MVGEVRPVLTAREEHQPVLVRLVRDRPWFPEYHWHGLALIVGNAYILAGLAMFGLRWRYRCCCHGRKKEHDDEPGGDQESQRGHVRLPAA